MTGWIKIHRKLKDHWLWQDAEKLKWWLDILFEANHEGRKVLLKGTLIDCERGQCVRSLETWAKEWRTTKKTVRAFFILLQKDSMISIESVTVSTRLTVCNYDSYQNAGHEKETQSKRRVNAKETQPTPKQECKELKELEECLGAPVGEEIKSAAFDEEKVGAFAKFEGFISREVPQVAQMQEPFTIKQYFKALETYSRQEIADTLRAMHNSKNLLKNNRSAYLTMKNWLRRDTLKAHA